MAVEENKAIIRRWMDECYDRGNWALMDELFAPDFVNHDPAAPMARDREGLKQVLAAQLTAFPDRRTTIEDLLAEGDKVTKRTTFRGTQTGTFGAIPPTG